MRTRLLLAAAGASSAALLGRLLWVASEQLRAPFDLVHETPNLATIQLLKLGLPPYAANLYARPPFVLTLYTPLYHALGACLPFESGNPFLWPRALSATCMLLAGALPLVALRDAGTRLVPVMAAALFFAFRPVVLNTAFVRSDPLALLLAAGAVVWLARRHGRRDGVVGPALLCALSLAAKQSYVAAPAACGLYLLATDRRAAAVFAATFAAAVGVLAAGATAAWGADFWFSVVVAPDNPFSLGVVRGLLANVAVQPAFVLLAGAGLLTGGASLLRGAWRPSSPYACYALTSLCVLVATLPKLGASTNYFFEPVLALVLWLAHAQRQRPIHAFVRGRGAAIAALVLACLVLELGLARRADVSMLGLGSASEVEAAYAHLRARLRAVAPANPTVLSLQDARPNFSVQARARFSDPYLYALLWRSGKLSPEPLIASLRRGHWDAVLLRAGSVPRRGRDPVRRVERAVFRNYRLASRGPLFDVYVPRRPAAARPSPLHG